MKFTHLLFSLVLCFLFNSSLAQNPEFWGITSQGFNGEGGIFKTDDDGNNLAKKHAFSEMPFYGIFAHYVKSGNTLFGVAQGGGAHSKGGIYSYNISTGKTKVLYHFGPNDGDNPGPVIVEGNKLYGLTHARTNVSYGELYEYDLNSHKYKVLVDFDSGNTGAVLSESLLSTNDGNLYGMSGGGMTSSPLGKLFKYNISNDQYTEIDTFQDPSKCGITVCPLMQASNNKIYGISALGGQFNKGVLFEYDLGLNQYKDLHHFNGSDGGGALENLGLTEIGQGSIYGMTFANGQYNAGVLFEYNFNKNSFQVVHHFTGGMDGKKPYGKVVQYANNKLYGMTYSGGISDHGVIFEFDTSSKQLQSIFNFDQKSTGFHSVSTLTIHSDGYFYSATNTGTPGQFGSIFKFHPLNKTFVNLQFINDFSMGYMPTGKLLFHSSGWLYGSARGGKNNLGILYRYHPTQEKFELAHSFENFEGILPNGYLSEGPQGLIYGAAWQGGDTTSNHGSVWAFNPILDEISFVIKLNENIHGRQPRYGLSKGLNDQCFTTTQWGGPKLGGCILRLDPVLDTLIVDYAFDEENGLYAPYGLLIPFGDGKLYGLCAKGGNFDLGGIYSFDFRSKVVNTELEFDSSMSQSTYINASIAQGPNSTLIGMGLKKNGKYSIFSFQPSTKSLTYLYESHDVNDGSLSGNKLMWATNNKLYGLTSNQGPNYQGTLFEFDPLNLNFIVKTNFNGGNGAIPEGCLTEINGDYNSVKEEAQSNLIKAFPNPATDVVQLIFPEEIKDATIAVLNMEGKEVLSTPLNQGKQFQLDIRQIPPGSYTLRIQSPEFIESTKLVKVE